MKTKKLNGALIFVDAPSFLLIDTAFCERGLVVQERFSYLAAVTFTGPTVMSPFVDRYSVPGVFDVPVSDLETRIWCLHSQMHEPCFFYCKGENDATLIQGHFFVFANSALATLSVTMCEE